MSFKVYPLTQQPLLIPRQSSETANQLRTTETDAIQANQVYEDKVELSPKPTVPYNTQDYISSIDTRAVAKAILEKVFL